LGFALSFALDFAWGFASRFAHVRTAEKEWRPSLPEVVEKTGERIPLRRR
jgi:hypothetical protein